MTRDEALDALYARQQVFCRGEPVHISGLCLPNHPSPWAYVIQGSEEELRRAGYRLKGREGWKEPLCNLSKVARATINITLETDG